MSPVVRLIPCALFFLAAMAFSGIASIASPQSRYGKTEVILDTWGIPHVFSETDAGAMYGLGYATAEQRGFQMTYSLRIMQGRLAEILGENPRAGNRESALDLDRKMRTFGWVRAARRMAANLDREILEILKAYCNGVNDSFAEQQRSQRLHPLFAKFGVQPEEWIPADCLLSWWHMSQFFATDGTRELIAWRNNFNPAPGQQVPPRPSQQWRDDSTAVVQREDVSDEWLRRAQAFAAKSGIFEGKGEPVEQPKFSHAWVVGGSRTTTGAAVLVSDPQTPVRNPSLWYEFHVSGKTFNARGIGVPGSPGLLIGFNQKVAWGITAAGADQADLFRLETDAAHPGQYRWNGKWRDMDRRTETIKVKGGRDVALDVRETHIGPVISAFAFRIAGEPEVALKRVPLCDTNQETIRSLVAMMRAKNAAEFARAIEGWRFPSANCIYGDAAGQIGYSLLGAYPVRARTAPDAGGNFAQPGSGDGDDWQGFVPSDLVPRILNPRRGLLFSANHRAIGSFYPIPLGLGTGSMGDTVRSWRLRELFAGNEKWSPEKILEVHYDTINPARREIVKLAAYIGNSKPGALSGPALDALRVLEPWLQAGASSDLKSKGSDLATRISTFFRIVATPLASKYGGGESGLARFLKDTAARLATNSKAEISEDECRFVDQALSDAWQQQGSRAPADARVRTAANPTPIQTLGWFESLDGFGSLDPAQDLRTQGITCLDGQTLHSQGSQSYTQWVPLHDVDSARSICPIGQSDRPDSPFRTSTIRLWGEASLHSAPLSRAAVAKLSAGTMPLVHREGR